MVSQDIPQVWCNHGHACAPSGRWIRDRSDPAISAVQRHALDDRGQLPLLLPSEEWVTHLMAELIQSSLDAYPSKDALRRLRMSTTAYVSALRVGFASTDCTPLSLSAQDVLKCLPESVDSLFCFRVKSGLQKKYELT